MAEPKKARTVEIDPNATLSFEEYDELLRHARNSSMWYIGRFPSHSSKLRKRLYEKGYPRDNVSYFNFEGEIEQGNLVESTIEELNLLHMVDDENYIESKIKAQIAKGKGVSLAVRELKFAGIPEDEIEAVLENLEDELDDQLNDAVTKAAERIMRSTPYRKAAQSWQKSMVLSGGLRAKGFDRDTVDNWLETNSELFED